MNEAKDATMARLARELADAKAEHDKASKVQAAATAALQATAKAMRAAEAALTDARAKEVAGGA
jgi:hypothetical protein